MDHLPAFLHFSPTLTSKELQDERDPERAYRRTGKRSQDLVAPGPPWKQVWRRGFIQDIITGRSQHPGEDALAGLATVLKCSPAYLIGQTDDPAGASVAHGAARCQLQTPPSGLMR